MNREQFIKEVELTPGDWEYINVKCGVDVLGIIINLDNQFSEAQQMDMIAERCNEVVKVAQDKILKHKDIALIDRDAKLPLNIEEIFEYIKRSGDVTYQRVLKPEYAKVIPLSEEIKELE